MARNPPYEIAVRSGIGNGKVRDVALLTAKKGVRRLFGFIAGVMLLLVPFSLGPLGAWLKVSALATLWLRAPGFMYWSRKKSIRIFRGYGKARLNDVGWFGLKPTRPTQARLVCIANSPMPIRAANNVHVANLTRSFADLMETVLICREPPLESYSQDMGKLMWGLDVLRLRSASYFRYSVEATCIALALGTEYVVTRNIFAAAILRRLAIRTVLDLHKVPRPRTYLRSVMKGLLAEKPAENLSVQCISNALRQELVSAMRVVPVLQVDVEPCAGPSIIGNPYVEEDRNFDVVYAGSSYRGKGFTEVALPIARSMPYLKFLFIGLTEAPNLRNVTAVGHVAPGRVVNLISRAKVAILPNQTYVEGNDGKDIGQWTSPLKMFEFMSAKTAIVASNLPVLQEVLCAEKTCVFVPSADIEAWRSAILKLLSDKESRELLSSQAFHLQQTEFTWDARAERILGRLQQL